MSRSGGESTWQVCISASRKKPKDPKLIKPDLPDWVARIVMHLLERDPALRINPPAKFLRTLTLIRSPSVPHGIRLLSARREPLAACWWCRRRCLAPVFFSLFLQRVTGSSRVEPESACGRWIASTLEGKFIAVLPFRVLGSEGSLNMSADGLAKRSPQTFPTRRRSLAPPLRFQGE